ncbi:MAG: Dabb family protein [Candidatus Omnitrophota bacterium]
MIKHIVMWKLKETAHGKSRLENAKVIKDMLESLQGKVPGLLKIEAGIDFSGTEQSADVVLYSEFTTREALEEYQTHAAHEAVKIYLMGARSERRIADYEV